MRVCDFSQSRPMSRPAVRYQWEDEPPERPSEFIPSTGYSLLSSGYTTPSELKARAARRHRKAGWGLKGIIIVGIALLAVCGYVMREAVKLLGG
jgi:hypothetical protein